MTSHTIMTPGTSSGKGGTADHESVPQLEIQAAIPAEFEQPESEPLTFSQRVTGFLP